MAQKYKGQIAIYKKERGFGFIQAMGFSNPLWFHISFVEDKDLREILNTADPIGFEVAFQVRDTPRGLQAEKIRPDSPYSDIDTFLRTGQSQTSQSKKEFIDLLTMDALVHIDKDETLSRLAVSRVIRSAEIWSNLTLIAGQWQTILSVFENAPSWSEEQQRTLKSFSQQLVDGLGFRPFGDQQLLNLLPAIVQPVAPFRCPVKCFRDAENISFVILPNSDALYRISRKDPSPLIYTMDHLRFVIILDEDVEAMTGFIQQSRLGIAYLTHRDLFSLMIETKESGQVTMGRTLRSVMPIGQIQPYTVGADYEETIFSGRANETIRILDNRSSNHAIYGGRKIGKTWFLKNICHRCESQPYLDYYFPFYISLQGVKSVDAATIMVEESITDKLGFPQSNYQEHALRLGFVLRKANQITGKTILLALDELDDLLSVEDNYDFFGRLRGLYYNNEGAFKFVFAGFKELMFTFWKETSNHPLANWVDKDHFTLGCLGEEDLQTLIVDPLRWVGLDFETNEIVQKIFDLTSGHPYYTQFLCHSIVTARLRQNWETLSVQNIEKLASDEFFEEVFDIFTANLSPLQLLIGKVFAEHDGAFAEPEILEALDKSFGIVIDHKSLREELKILQACSVLLRTSDGYRPVMQRINREFFKRQDALDLALRSLELKNDQKQNP